MEKLNSFQYVWEMRVLGPGISLLKSFISCFRIRRLTIKLTGARPPALWRNEARTRASG